MTTDHLQIRSPFVAPALALVRAAGGRPDDIARRFGLPDTAEVASDVTLPFSALQALLREAEAQAGDPFLGVNIASRLRPGAYGVLEYSCRNAPTIRDGLARIVRYIALANEFAAMSLTEQGGVGAVDHALPGLAHAYGRHGNEALVVNIVLQARGLAGVACAPEAVWFAHPRPANVSRLVDVLGTTNIRFGAPVNRLVLSEAFLSARIAAADPMLLALLDRYAEQALAARGASRGFLDQVRRQIREQLSDQAPTLDSLAAAFGMSARTLQRRLGDEGVSFHAVLEGVREHLARFYVSDRKLPLGEIAFLLGYSDLTAFLRAFRRWTGMTPTQFRAL